MAGNENGLGTGKLGGFCLRGKQNADGIKGLRERMDHEAEENEAMRRSWARAWLPWLTSMVLVAIAAAVVWGQVSQQLDTNCRRLDRVETQMEAVGQDVSYMRGMMEREFGK